MAGLDLVICGTTIVSAAKTMRCDVGTRKGRTAALGERLEGGRTSDAFADAEGGAPGPARCDLVGSLPVALRG